jgi:hypothetical protein
MIKIGKFVLFAALLVCSLSACTDFFSSSWGTGLKRDPSKVEVNSGNVAELVKAAKNDPELSREILSKIADEVKNATGRDKTELQKAAVTAATQASGLSTLVVSNAGAIIEGKAVDLTQLLTDIQAQANDIGGISDDLSTILSMSVTEGKPEFPSGLAKSMSESDLTMLVVIVALGQVEELDTPTTMTEYLEAWGNGTKDIEDAETLDDKEKVAAAAVNAMLKYHPDSELTNMLREALQVQENNSDY